MGERIAPTNAARIRVPFIPLEWHDRYVTWATKRLDEKLHPDTSQIAVQTDAVQSLRSRRIGERVEGIGGASLVVAGGIVFLATGGLAIPVAAAGLGLAAAVDGARRAIRDRRFGLNLSSEELGRLEQAEATPAVTAAAERVATAERRAITSRAGVETAMVDVVSTTAEAARVAATAEVTGEPVEGEVVTGEVATTEIARPDPAASVQVLQRAISERDAAALAVRRAKAEAAKVAEEAGGAVAERRRLTDNYYLEREGRLRVRVRGARLARLAQRVWEDSKRHMNNAGSVQGTAEGIVASSRSARRRYKEKNRNERPPRRGRGRGADASTAAVIYEANDNQQ